MKKYTFGVTGASLYGGEIMIIAKTIKTARRLAREQISEYNECSPCNTLRLTGEEYYEPFYTPMIVYFESGEA